MKLTIDYTQLCYMQIPTYEDQFPHEVRPQFRESPGQNFYQLYSYIACQFSGVRIADIGARHGNSALALSYNMSNHVDSYEIHPPYFQYLSTEIKKPNITFFNEDILTSEKILQYPLISLDVDPHDGVQEAKCFEFLETQNYKGIILLDDIMFPYQFPKLLEWWHSIKQPKWDLTRYGHFSGTGLVDFTGELEVELR